MAQGPARALPADTYYVALNGNNAWSGLLPKPNAEKTDGPFATPEHARDVLRYLQSNGTLQAPCTVYLREGRHELDATLTFDLRDSLPVTYASYPGEQAILDGGREIKEWTETTVHDRKAWVAELPEVKAGNWTFKQLFVNDERRPRPQLPKQGEYQLADLPGQTLPTGWGQGQNNQFRLQPGQMKNWHNLTDVEVVAFHWWIDERLPVASFDEKTELITTSRKSWSPLVDSNGSNLATCVIENVFEALTEPGEWYLDRTAGKLYYLPKPGETLSTTRIFAPRLLQLMTVTGDPEASRYVKWLRFENLQFQHSRGIMPGDPDDTVWTPWKDPSRDISRHYQADAGSSAQGAGAVPGAVQLRGVHHSSFVNCRVAHVGWYGMELGDGCQGIHLRHCEIVDTGAGGIKMNGGSFTDAPSLRTGLNQITDCELHEGGRIFHSGIGILAMHAYGNTISHNHIHDYFYSGISCGWVWGYAPSITRDNHIEKNHIHNLGQGLLSDMGGVYLLGVQSGTVVRGNLIHDITKRVYGAWCLYTDEGSSHILLENNICYRTNGEIFHQHYGRENLVRNNILAFGDESLTAFSRFEGHIGFTLQRNVLITDGPSIYKGGYANVISNRALLSDTNLLWQTDGGAVMFEDKDGRIDLQAWRKHGRDISSRVGDPKCRNMAEDDFTLAADSPAFALGFEPIDMTDVGPRPIVGN